MRTLVAGWFSFEEMGATAGDLIARDLVGGWLTEAGRKFHYATAAPFTGGVDWRTVDPNRYEQVVFVCGPFGNGWPVTDFLARFAGRPLVGVNLTMLQSLDEWNPFDLLLERDSSTDANPDVTFLSEAPKVPVVGLCLIHPQDEYGKRSIAHEANDALRALASSRELAVVEIDTRLDIPNEGGLRTPAEIESLLARMDVVLTTRLHGMALSLKNGVPVLAIDPVAGGAKIRRQAAVVDWPIVFDGDAASPAALAVALDWCLSEEGRRRASECRPHAVDALGRVRESFLAHFGSKT